MPKHKKKIIYLILFLVFITGLAFLYTQLPVRTTAPLTPTENSQTQEEASFILQNYPLSKVPLLHAEKISSMKYFVNDDQSSEYLYGGPVNYYNVVFYTDTNRSELFAAYQQLMDNINADETNDSKLSGQIADYRVDVSQYSEDSDTAYMQVILPADKFQKANPYFTDYPHLVEIHPSWIEKESSYGLLNQKGGEIEHTQYFILDQALLPEEAQDNPFTYFFESYQQKYQDQTDFTVDNEKYSLTWKDSDYQLTITFSADHSRVYLMIRQPLTP